MRKQRRLLCAIIIALLCSSGRVPKNCCHGFAVVRSPEKNTSRQRDRLIVGMVAADDGGAPILSRQDRSITARRLVFDGLEAFRGGNIPQSIELFDQAEETQGSSLTPFLWQRGISYYYNNEFEKASRQFRTDVRVNPSDVEEIVWDIASQLRLRPDTFPVSSQLALPPGTRDRRRIMVRAFP